MNQEYCLLFFKSGLACMNKSEWAAWAQVVGSVGALCVAIYIPYLHKKIERRESLAMADSCLQLHIGIFTAIQDLANQGHSYKNAIKASKEAIGLAIDAYTTVRASSLPSKCWPAWYSAQTNLLQLQALIDTPGVDCGFGKAIEKYKNTAQDLRNDFICKASEVLRSKWRLPLR